MSGLVVGGIGDGAISVTAVPPTPPPRQLLRAPLRRLSVLGWEGTVGAVILLGVLGCCILVPAINGQNPNAFVANPLLSPSWKYPLGTDEYGRDVFLRVCYGGRIDFAIAAIGVIGSLCIGTVIGISVTSARRRIWETLVMRLVDSIIAFPFIVLVLIFVVIFGSTSGIGPLPRGVPALLGAIFLWDWTVYARLARSRTLELRNADFITAARLLGYSRLRVMGRHLLPAVLRTTATYAVGDSVIILITTAALPFLGAGVQPPTPEWGQIMYDGQTFLSTAWWITIGPAIALALTGIGISLLADSLIGGRKRRLR